MGRAGGGGGGGTPMAWGRAERTGDMKPPGITMSTIAAREHRDAKTLIASASRVAPLVSTGTVN